MKTALLTVVLAGVATQAFAAGSISGKVTGPGPAFLPLPSKVVVQVFDLNESSGDPFASAETDPVTGNYTINLPAGSYAVATQNTDGYINEIYNNVSCSAVCDINAIAHVVVTNSAVTNINFELDTATVGGRISGKVTQADGITAIPGVLLYFVDSGGNVPFTTAVTKPDGTYISDAGSVTGGVYIFTANTLGYIDEGYDNIHCEDCGDLTLVPVTLGLTTGNINFALDLGGRISGTVSDANGNPLANVGIDIRDADHPPDANDVSETRTDGSGNYLSSGLPAGNYFVITRGTPGLLNEVYNNIPCPGGFCNLFTNLGAPIGTPIPVTVGATAPGRDFVLSPGGTISGTVTEAVGGAPVDGLFIQFFTATGGVPTYVGGTHTSGSGTGAYSITVPPGTYFAAVINQDGFGNQIYSGLTCIDNACNPANGTPLTVTTGGSINNVNFALVGRGTILGSVSIGGVPSIGVQVQVLSTSGTLLGNQTTIAGGLYSFTGLAVGSYYVRTNTNNLAAINKLHNGVDCVQCNVTNSGGTLVPVTADATTTINFALTVGARISGKVTGPAGNISGMSVQIFTATGVPMGSFGTNGTGDYTSFGLPPGNYRVKTAANATQNFLDEVWNDHLCVPCAVQTGDNVAIVGTTNTSNINFALAAGGSISGLITDAGAGGAAIPGISVLAFDSTGVLVKNVTSDALGNYTFNGLPTGNYFIRVNPGPTQNYASLLFAGLAYNGLPLTGTPVGVTAGSATPGVNFALSSGGTISGTVKDAVSNAPLAGVQVAVYSPAGRPVRFPGTDLTGTFNATGLPAGTYYVSTTVTNLVPPFYIDELHDNLACVGCVSISSAALPNVTLPCALPCTPPVTTGTPVVVTNGGTQAVNFLLSTGGGIISGVVIDAATGIGLVNVQVSVYNAAGVLVKSVTSGANTGGYVVRGLAPGTYYARTIVSPATPYYTDQAYTGFSCAPCTVTSTTAITVTANTTTTGINFALSPGGQISGFVTNSAASPLALVEVQLFNAAGSLVKTTIAGSTGAFTFDGLPAGNYYARTAVPSGSVYVDKLYNNISCVSCTVTGGTAIAVTNGATRSGINFALNQSPTISSAPGSATPANTPIMVNFTVGDTESGASGVSVSVFSSNTTLVPNANLTVSGTAATRTVTVSPAANRQGVTMITVIASDGSSVTSTSFVLVVGQHLPRGDFDGDGKSDAVVYRPSNGTWFALHSGTNATTWTIFQWGLPGDVPVSGDYDGDGQADMAVYRPSNGTWFLLKSSTNNTAWTIFQWGLTGDIPTPGDFDGDGKTDMAVFRPSTGYWYLLKSSTNNTTWTIFQWGLNGDIPTPGDFDGDGKTDMAVFRPSNGFWYLLKSSTNFASWTIFQWGVNGDIPAPGDYDGDGKTDMAVFRPSNGFWYLLKSSTNFASWTIFQWGVNGDVPMPGDYDDDGKTDMAVYRPSNGLWFLLKSSTNFSSWTIRLWGISGDVPVLQH